MIGMLRFLVCWLALVALTMQSTSAEEAEKPVSYYRQIRPLLQRHCSGCHQPAKSGGNLLLTGHAEFLKGGENGPGFVPGKPEESLIVTYISGEKPEMPLNAEPLTKEQVALFEKWITQGGVDDSPASARDEISPTHPPIYHAPPVITALAYSPDSQQLAVSGYHEILLHKADGSESLGRLVGRSPKITSIEFAANGQFLAATGGAPALFGELQVWDPTKHELLRSATISFDTLFGVSISDDSQQIGFGSFDNKARVVQAADLKPAAQMDAHSDLVFDTTFSLKHDHLISVSRDMSMKLTEVKTSQFIDNITSITPGALKGGLMCVQRHPKEEHVLMGGADGEPKLYKIFRTEARRIGDDFNKIRTYQSLPGRICSVSFNADGSQFVVGASNATSGSARIYQTDDGKLLHELPGHTAGVFAVAFRPDGQQVATGGIDGSVRLFDVATGALVKEFLPVTITPVVAGN